MQFIDYIFNLIFLISAIYDALVISSAVNNWARRRPMSEAKGILKGLIAIGNSTDVKDFTKSERVTLACNFLILLMAWSQSLHAGPLIAVLYTVVIVIIGGIYYYHYFVHQNGKSSRWFYLHEEPGHFTENTRAFYEQTVIKDLFYLLVVNVPFVVFWQS